MGLRWQDGPEGLAARLRACGGRAGFLERDAAVIGMGAALLVALHDAHRVVAGCRNVPRRQGAQGGTWTRNGHEMRAPGRTDRITAVAERHLHLSDDVVVRDTLHRWLS